MNTDKVEITEGMPLTVDRDLYVLACFFVSVEELKELGLVAGGPDIDIEFFRSVKTLGECLKFAEPSRAEMESRTHYFRAGGEFDRECLAEA